MPSQSAKVLGQNHSFLDLEAFLESLFRLLPACFQWVSAAFDSATGNRKVFSLLNLQNFGFDRSSLIQMLRTSGSEAFLSFVQNFFETLQLASPSCSRESAELSFGS